MMQKKLFTFALVAGLAAPLAAFADNANVTFYGLLDADVELVKTSAGKVATDPTSRGRITSNASRFGLKGSDDLGNGLQGIFQVESRVNVAGNEVGGGGGVFSGMRNTHIGLKGDFGTAFLGNWDTPYKVVHNKVELFDNSSIATATALMGNNGQGVAGTGFNLRQNSSVQYWTPNMSGLQAKAAYSFVNTAPGSSTATPRLFSLSLAYENGPIYVAFANEQHKGISAVVPTAPLTEIKDSANRLVGAYSIGAGQVGLTFEKLSTADTNGATSSRSAIELSGKYSIDENSTIGGFFTRAGNVTGLTNSGATQLSLRYGYAFTKRTELYAMYTNITNKTAAKYNFVDVASLSSAAGAKLSGFGVGVRHTF